MHSVVNANHPSAQATYAPSRDMKANFGAGTLRREDPNMLRSRQVAISLGGFTQPKWGQSRAVEFRGGVLPKSRAMDVVARSGNQTNLQAIGMGDTAVEAQVGQGTPAATPQGIVAKLEAQPLFVQVAFWGAAIWTATKVLDKTFLK